LGIPGDEAVAEQGRAELVPIMDYIESQAPQSGWLAGDDFSIGDIAVACTLRSLGYVGLEPDPSSYPRAAAWYDRVKARPSWRLVAEREAAVMSRVLPSS
jgi:glutathione S-transferase